jgi:hypothetical protein
LEKLSGYFVGFVGEDFRELRALQVAPLVFSEQVSWKNA